MKPTEDTMNTHIRTEKQIYETIFIYMIIKLKNIICLLMLGNTMLHYTTLRTKRVVLLYDVTLFDGHIRFHFPNKMIQRQKNRH